MDYRKLNFITFWDAFPLPYIDDALQVVHNCNVFTSLDLPQGYLQLAVAKDGIKKTAFRAGSLGVYECTCMPFGLSNAGSSFCRLMSNVLVISSLSPYCCIMMTSVFLLQILAPCWTKLIWYLICSYLLI